jgi:hypothetical protein
VRFLDGHERDYGMTIGYIDLALSAQLRPQQPRRRTWRRALSESDGGSLRFLGVYWQDRVSLAHKVGSGSAMTFRYETYARHLYRWQGCYLPNYSSYKGLEPSLAWTTVEAARATSCSLSRPCMGIQLTKPLQYSCLFIHVAPMSSSSCHETSNSCFL